MVKMERGGPCRPFTPYGLKTQYFHSCFQFHHLVPKCMLVCWKKDVENFPNLPFPSHGVEKKKKKEKKKMALYVYDGIMLHKCSRMHGWCFGSSRRYRYISRVCCILRLYA